jgi:hypothetical protein
MPLVISQVAGLILTRYVIGLEPIASMRRRDRGVDVRPGDPAFPDRRPE